MKKLKNKISKYLKIFLAFSLIFNSLTPIGVVFADETENNDKKVSVNELLNNNDTNNNNNDTNNNNNNNENNRDVVKDEFSVTINEKQVTIKYTNVENLTATSLIINEDFEYLDKSTLGGLFTEITLTDEIKSSLKEGYVIDSDILNENIYDGTYTITATIGEENADASLEINNGESGFLYEVYDDNNTLLEKNEEGKYVVNSDTFELVIKAKVLLGGLVPTDTFTYNDELVELSDLLNGIEVSNIELDGNLYGEFTANISSNLFKNADSNTFDGTFDIVYGTYKENTDVLNESTKNVELDKKYIFYGDTSHGIIYSLDEFDYEEIESILADALADNENITYLFDEGVLVLTDNNGVFVTYTGVYLNEKTKITTNITNDNEGITSGDEFKINYLVKLKDFAINGASGLIDYDKEILELVSVESELFTGITNEDAFLFIGNPIKGKLVTDDSTGEESYEEEEYIIVTLTFKALKAGTSNVSVKNAKFYNNNIYYQSEEESETEVIVDSSSDNSISKLVIGEIEVELEEGVLDYELEVSNDITNTDLEIILNSETAVITSVVCPEELAEGDNTIIIVVKAENGDEKQFTIKLSREEAEKEETVATYVENNYTNTSNLDSDDKTEVIEKEEKKEEEKEDVKDKKDNKVTRMIVIGLISLAVIGLIYLIFKDDDNTSNKATSLNKTNEDKQNKSQDNKHNYNDKNNYEKKRK